MARNLDRLKDLVPHILHRLPVKSLVRFRGVHKSWSDLIKDPNFIFDHLQTLNQINMDNYGFCFLVKRIWPADPLFLVGKDFVHALGFHQAATLDFLDIVFKHRSYPGSFQMYGPLNGVYYIHKKPSLLINPSMREFRFVPETPPFPENLIAIRHNGFGFDHRTDDYKVVCITSFFIGEDMLRRVHVYALSCNYWRNVDCPFPSCVHIQCQPLSDTFVHGASHWWACDGDGELVLAFDMLDEMFQVIRFPKPEVKSCNNFPGNVAKFKEFLAVILCPEYVTEKQFDIWVMLEYGKKESWIKLFTIGPIAGVQKPLAFWKDGIVFGDNSGGMVLYDTQTEMKESFEFRIEPLMATAYMESVVSLRRDIDDIVPELRFDTIQIERFQRPQLFSLVSFR
ncbi:hypothetical protein L6164_020388 [Bauhinia variegata]|uniref:Uncharacterized protein n=1 Tax=Bauhinia variegata TaxID=167791 RepID=A0ACB9MUV3_BAUVA|nr:hypothetical protein L6164_020388 [Bauhinia variegata]